MQSFNMQKQTLTKCPPPLTFQSIAHFNFGKHSLILISNQKSIKIYNINNEKFQDQLKLPSDAGAVSCITISDDLFFFAYGMHIAASGYNGKIIFDFDTYIAADRIDRIHVVGYRLWVFCGPMINQFVLGGGQLSNKMSRKMQSSNKVEDIRSHMLEAKINNSVCIEDQFSKHYLILLKNNNLISVFQQKQLISHKTSSPPLCIVPYKSSSIASTTTTTSTSNRFLIGTQSGQILCLEIDKKSIKQVWKIGDNGGGRVNLLLIVKSDGIFVARDKVLQLWSPDRQLQGNEQIEQKYTSAIYLPQKNFITLNSQSGQIMQLKDYIQMLKDYEKQSIKKTRKQLEQQIQKLKNEKKQLQQKINIKLNNRKQKQKNVSVDVNVVNNVNVDIIVNIDYRMYCNVVEIRSQGGGIGRVVGRGRVGVGRVTGRVVFQGKENNGDSVFIIDQQQSKQSNISISSPPSLTPTSPPHKLHLTTYISPTSNPQSKQYAITRTIDLKLLCMYHKTGPLNLPAHNILTITGQFKYFHINTYMNTIFWEFGENGSNDGVVQVWYEGVVGGDGVGVRFGNGECEVRAVSPVPLLVIKQYLFQKQKQKHQPLNISLHPSPSSITTHIPTILSKLQPLLSLQSQHALLPGLYQLQNEQNLTKDLKQLLEQKQEIERKYKQNLPLLNALKDHLRQIYVGYRKIKDQDVGEFEVEGFWRVLEGGDVGKIVGKIVD